MPCRSPRSAVRLAVAAAALSLAPAAHAARMVVRLQAQGADFDAVTVTVTGEASDPVDIALKDDGATPDVTEGDGVWSATAEVAGDSLAVRVAADGETWDAGSVEWTDTELARDLDIAYGGGKMTASAGTALPQPSGGTVPQGSGETPDGGPPVSTVSGEAPPDGTAGKSEGTPSDGPAAGPVAPGEAPAAGPPVASGAPSAPTAQSTGDDGSAQLFIIFGLGLLGLVLLGWMWFSANRGGRSEVPLPRPQPPLLGPGTPSLSDNDSIWRAAPADLSALAGALVGRIAQERPVLLAAAEGVDVPPVHGGPVYPAVFLEVDPIADLADALEEQLGRPVAVVLVGDAAAAAHAGLRGELADSAALVLIGTTEATVEPRAVRCTKHGSQWRLTTADGESVARMGAFGLEPVWGAPGPAA